MELSSNLKDLYIEWLQELVDGLTPKQEQLKIAYEKAKRNLQNAEGSFYYPTDLKKVKGIGNTIIKRLDTKLRNYCKIHHISPVEAPSLTQTSSTRPPKRTTTALRSIVNSCENDKNEAPEEKGTKREKLGSIYPKRDLEATLSFFPYSSLMPFLEALVKSKSSRLQENTVTIV